MFMKVSRLYCGYVADLFGAGEEILNVINIMLSYSDCKLIKFIVGAVAAVPSWADWRGFV